MTKYVAIKENAAEYSSMFPAVDSLEVSEKTFEATNRDIPGPYYEYDGYGETYLVGMLMNTPNDYVEYIETYFPGRPMAHLKQFSTLLNLLLTQTDYNQ